MRMSGWYQDIPDMEEKAARRLKPGMFDNIPMLCVCHSLKTRLVRINQHVRGVLAIYDDW